MPKGMSMSSKDWSPFLHLYIFDILNHIKTVPLRYCWNLLYILNCRILFGKLAIWNEIQNMILLISMLRKDLSFLVPLISASLDNHADL